YPGGLRLWDLAPEQMSVLLGHTEGVNSVAISPDGMRVLSGSEDWTLRLWDLSTGQTLKVLQGHSAAIRSVAFSPNGKQALSGSADGTVLLWDLATGDTLQTLTGRSAITSVQFSPDGKHTVSGSVDGTIRLWEPNNHTLRTLTVTNVGKPLDVTKRWVSS